MTLPKQLGRTAAKGSSNLFVGMVVSTLILAAESIVVARLLGSGQYGLYTVSGVPTSFLHLFVNFGVHIGIFRYLAYYNHRSENEKSKGLIASGLVFIAVVGSIFALLSFFLSKTTANYLGRPDASSLIEIYSLMIPAETLINALQLIFISLEKTQYYAILSIFQAILRLTTKPILIVIGFGPLGAVAGHVVSSLISVVFGLFIVFFPLWKRLPSHFVKSELLSSLKMMIHYGFPLYIRDLVKIGIETYFLNFLMILYTGNILIGNYRAALNFHSLLDFIAMPISSILFQTFSKLDARSDHKHLKTIFTSSVKYTSLFIVPTTVALIVLSEPLVLTLYGGDYNLAPLYLSLSALVFLYPALGRDIIVHFLSSQGKTDKSMILGFANAVLAVPLALIFIPRLQIVGLIITLIISGAPTIIFGSWWIKKLYNFSIDWNQEWKVIACSFVIGMATFAVLRYFSLPNLLWLIIGFLVFSFLFLVLSPLMGVVDLDDVSNLRDLFRETILVSSALEIPFWLFSKSCRFADNLRANHSA